MSKIGNATKIYIIESPRDVDLIDERIEGKALSSALSLAEIRNQYYQVSSSEALIEVFKRIAIDINKLKKEEVPEGGLHFVAPYCHFSCHGNKNGIQLTNREILEWKILGGLIKEYLSDPIEYILSQDLKTRVSPLNIAFSSCEGFYGHIMSQEVKEEIYSVMVGPKEPVEWADSLLAFTVYYHKLFYKGKATGSLKLMNAIVGKDSVYDMTISEIAINISKELMG